MKHRLISALLASAVLFGASSALAGTGTAVPSPLMPRASSALAFDAGYIKGIAPQTAVSTLAGEFDGTLSVTDPSGKSVSDDAFVGTDFVLTTENGTASALVAGDVNRDGNVNAKDVTAMLRQSAGMSVDISAAAFDVNLDGATNMKDASAIMKHIAGWQITLGYTGWGVDLSKLDAEYEDYSIEMYFSDPVTKLDRDIPEFTEQYSYKMELARGEGEACTMVLYSFLGTEGVTLRWSDFADKNGNTLKTDVLLEDYLYVEEEDSWVADRMPPANGAFDLAPEQCRPVYIKATTATDSPAGLYRAKIGLFDADGNEIKAAYVYAEVWDFEVPVERSVASAIGMGAGSIHGVHGVDWGTEEAKQIYTNYYEYLLDCRLTPWCMPENPMDEAAEKWMDDPRVTTFLVSGGYGGDLYNNHSDEEVIKVYEHIKDNETWMKKAIFYVDDEPDTEEKLTSVKNHYTSINAIFPGARIIAPQAPNYIIWGEDIMELLFKYTTVMCPTEKLFPGYDMIRPSVLNWYTQEVTERYGTIYERIAEWKAAGREVWWYTANSPYPPMANVDIENTGMENRVLFWIQYTVDTNGYLYYAATEWGNTSTKTGYKLHGNEGILLYPGASYGIDGPVACIRAETARDSLEDYEYLKLVEKLCGKEKADEFAGRIVENVCDFERDYNVLAQVRREMAQTIMGAK